MEYVDRYQQAQMPKYDCLLFDLDETLYPLSSGLAIACCKNIEEASKIPEMCNLLYKNYGTTMASLRIFTNADRVHAAKVLSRLGLEDCFEGIICFETLNPTHKNSISGDNDDFEMFYEDSVHNIQSGKLVGLHTVLIGTSHRTKGADDALESIHNIREALPELWETNEKSEKVRYSCNVAMETFVTA
ncbi:hypothetical protein HHK36_019550 [Tetracentron sinense]|uniref:Uncharacterized protein n=1 Tax=Tetracentron sinense TaxID=13715 RepID=A0A834YWF6_TETSI|nr:hypothetical protein HHK36_019550 [Tetracentron sinense]